ncbi:MAG: hypothetical protein HY822_05215 [Acidobacteria bacterium]|nr:hypothetical protein [Acidobacteriota bacterium]
MRKVAWLVGLLCIAALVVSAAAIDGKWVADVKMPAGKKGGEGKTASVTLNLKSDGAALTGTASVTTGRRDNPMEIQNGKIEGDSISFTTVQKGKKKEQKLAWRGTIQGAELKGEWSRDGARRGTQFTAKRQ